ncbi:hypothetical protein [Roseomonas xinghualingensis]|uniref:hypothetical protein n=1 Tax=Roseomonas xinghualingensis TaxID=2986475 RepID=UPI0021F0B404|nr:hypothetical protein [Roseomonas sp. SXEYE001]MCV4209167.1 hypothetical protein [Roseomonas sp. SXEYE001]
MVTLIRAPDADWGVEIAIAWRLLVDPGKAADDTDDGYGWVEAAKPSNAGRLDPLEILAFEAKPLPPCDRRSGSGAPHGPSTRNWIIPMNAAVAPFSGPLCWLKHPKASFLPFRAFTGSDGLPWRLFAEEAKSGQEPHGAGAPPVVHIAMLRVCSEPRTI